MRVQPVGLEFQFALSPKGMRDFTLDQFRSEALGHGVGHRWAAMLQPIDFDLLAVLRHRAPVDGHPAVRNRERTMLDRVRDQFVQNHAQCQGGLGPQHDLRTMGLNRLVPAIRQRGDRDLQQLAERDLAPVFP